LSSYLTNGIYSFAAAGAQSAELEEWLESFLCGLTFPQSVSFEAQMRNREYQAIMLLSAAWRRHEMECLRETAAGMKALAGMK